MDKVCFFIWLAKIFKKICMLNSKMSKTLSREVHSGKKSYVSETVTEICGGKFTICFRLAAAAL